MLFVSNTRRLKAGIIKENNNRYNNTKPCLHDEFHGLSHDGALLIDGECSTYVGLEGLHLLLSIILMLTHPALEVVPAALSPGELVDVSALSSPTMQGPGYAIHVLVLFCTLYHVFDGLGQALFRRQL